MPQQRMDIRMIKDILRLKFQGGLSHERIAQSLGVSKGAVAKRVEVHGWDRETFTTAATVANNQGGHRHGKTKVGLMKMRTLDAIGAMRFVGKVTL